jgi:two-component system, NtrC family, sensor kinase
MKIVGGTSAIHRSGLSGRCRSTMTETWKRLDRGRLRCTIGAEAPSDFLFPNSSLRNRGDYRTVPSSEIQDYPLSTAPSVADMQLAALEALNDGVWISEMDGSVVYRNAAAAAMEQMYWSSGGHVGTLEDVVFNEELLEQLRERGSGLVEFHLSSDGDEPAQVSSVAMEMQVLISDDAPMGLSFHARDVTREWMREQMLQDRNVELEQAYARLTTTQSQLLQSEKMASIGQLAAGVAHEINNPIGYVHSNLGTLQIYVRGLVNLLDSYENLTADSPDIDSPAQMAVKEIKRQIDYGFMREDLLQLLAESREGIERVRKIVLDLRDFSHGGQSEVEEWVTADIHRGLESTLNIVWSELKYKAVIQKDFSELPLIECLPAQLNQVFLNLLINAGQAIKEHGVITITTSCSDEEITVAIADDGVGIASEYLKKIYDPFFTTKPVGKGTGLGLALSYGIIKKHHGRIDAESQLGQGTCFRIHLPIHQPLHNQ